jgi:acetyltransferase-like isoleucine patch superfamily enzyme
VEQVKQHLIRGHVSFGNYTAVGSNSVVMPNNRIPEGTVLGALSFAPTGYEFKPWSVYAGTPIRLVGARNREAVMEQVEKLTKLLEQRTAARDK